MTSWTPPEGMVPCEVGPVMVRYYANGKPVYGRIVGFVAKEGPYFGDLKLNNMKPVYRPCDEDGEWLS